LKAGAEQTPLVVRKVNQEKKELQSQIFRGINSKDFSNL
jgi:hypothetical protein